MEQYRFTDEEGSFLVKNPELTSYLYFPLAGESGVMSSVTPLLGGDSKTGQNTFLLEPVSSENLHNNKSSRNFWLKMKNGNLWSATGMSAHQQAEKFKKKEETVLEAGIMWHKVSRRSEVLGVSSEITTFVPNTKDRVELTRVVIENIGKNYVTATPVAAVPIYARSADNIRDHRDVTAMLHRIVTIENGVVVNPTLTFDERGHRENTMLYGVFGRGNGHLPIGFIPTAEEFIGEGGNFENPGILQGNEGKITPPGTKINGFEAMGGIVFEELTLNPGEKAVYIIALGYGEKKEKEEAESEIAALGKAIDRYLNAEAFEKSLEETKKYWTDKVNVSYQSGDKNFDQWMYWVNFQPMLRRIYGCSFLPHHDYGKGGRGWRDLWQDCLALLLMNPSGVREMLLANFEGVRLDGTNATIIGSKRGEFIADRNGITRVWMDHGMWPFITVNLYIRQSGDMEFLLEETEYFKDAQVLRGEAEDSLWQEEQGSRQKISDGRVYRGSILEHMLLQHLTAFYDVGEHNHMRLRGADWNDALDMANHRGESVAFTSAYAGNMQDMAELILRMKQDRGVEKVWLAEELVSLLSDGKNLYDDVEAKRNLLLSYGKKCRHSISGRKIEVETTALAANLQEKALWMKEHIRNTEWIVNKEQHQWFNSYYDDSGRAVEGDFGETVRMMLTGQVFAVMSGTAEKEQVEKIVQAADRYLYAPELGGYRLNTDFKEVKTDMGRMFGFAYGKKENGAVFCHMVVMFSFALYKRGFTEEAYHVIDSLYRHISDAKKSKIYPGIPEYIDPRGRGVYHYLTGAASWLLLTVLTEMFGVKGEYGNLCLEPKLLPKQFDEKGEAAVCLEFAGRKLRVTYSNPHRKKYGEYQVGAIMINGKLTEEEGAVIKKEVFAALPADEVIEISAVLD